MTTGSTDYTVTIPKNCRRFDFSYDNWRKQWHCWALVYENPGTGNERLIWMHGMGENPVQARIDLKKVGIHEYDHPPKHLENRGHRYIEERDSKREIKPKPKLEDLF